jgi:hypothetical protein
VSVNDDVMESNRHPASMRGRDGRHPGNRPFQPR